MSLLAAGVLGHSLGSFTDSVFGQFTGQKQPEVTVKTPLIKQES